MLNSKLPAAIEYDPRLHVDTHTAAVVGSSDNMLSVSARFPTLHNWAVLKLERNEQLLLYTSVAEAWPDMRHARHRHELFPFPPESVAHVAHVFSQIQACARRWAQEVGAARGSCAPARAALDDVHERADAACALRYTNDLLPAMLQLGRSIGPDEVAHEQCTLTLCSVQDGRELPCMSWEHGLLFTARVERQRVVLQPTVATHEWPGAAGLASGNVMPFSAMPFAEGASVCVSEFYELLKHGVCMQDGSISIDVRQAKTAGARGLPCVLCPVVHWPVLLLLVEDGWAVARPGAAPLRVRPSREVFYEHQQRFAVARCCAGSGAARDVAFEETLAAVAAAARIDAAVLSAAAQACLALEGAASLCFACSPGGALEGAWVEHADGSLAFFASAAELCYSMLVVAAGEQKEGSSSEASASEASASEASSSEASAPRAQLIAARDEQLCDVRVLESGRHVAPYWSFRTHAVLRELRDEAAQQCAAHEALALGAAPSAADREGFDNRREALCEARDETAQLFAESSQRTHAVGARSYAGQTLFDLASLQTTFAPAGDLLLRSPERAAGAGPALPASRWGLVLEREAVFLRRGRYAVSALAPQERAAAQEAPAPPSSVLFEMDFATMSRAMLQEGSELWVHVNSTVYARIVQEALFQGTKVMLPVSPELHARLGRDPQTSRVLRAFYVLGGSSNVAPIDANSIRVIVLVASKSSAQGRKSAADDHADASSRINASVGSGDTKMLAICLPLYAADGSPLVTYHRDPALPFYCYMKEDSTARARGPAAT